MSNRNIFNQHFFNIVDNTSTMLLLLDLNGTMLPLLDLNVGTFLLLSSITVSVVIISYILIKFINIYRKKFYVLRKLELYNGIILFNSNHSELLELINEIFKCLDITYILNCFLLLLLLIIAIIFFVESDKRVSIYYPRSLIFMNGDNGMVPPPRNLLEKTIKVVKDAIGQGDAKSVENVEQSTWKSWFCWIVGASIIVICIYKWGGTIIDFVTGKSHLIERQELPKQGLPVDYTNFSNDIKMLKTKEIKEFKFLRSSICFEGIQGPYFSKKVIQHCDLLKIESKSSNLYKATQCKRMGSSLNKNFPLGQFLYATEANVNYIKNIHLPKVESFTTSFVLDKNSDYRLHACNIYSTEYQIYLNSHMRYIFFLKELGLTPIVNETTGDIGIRRMLLDNNNKKYIQECNILLYDKKKNTVTLLLEYCGIGRCKDPEDLERLINFYLKNPNIDIASGPTGSNIGKAPLCFFIIETELMEDILLRKDLISTSKSMDFEVFKSRLKLHVLD